MPSSDRWPLVLLSMPAVRELMAARRAATGKG
jgi:hypothetical protein